MRPIRTSLAATLAALLLAPTTHAFELRNFDDAPLHAVQFVDAREGWAVGEEGVVWHTIDGGKNWERQPTGVRASLRSLHFLTPYVGWVAGREELSGGQSAGILLFTSDGGVKWQRALAGSVPGLNFVRFVNDKLGYIAGDGSDTYPTGVFVTRDSGETWKPVAGPRFPSWLAGSVANNGLALAGAWGRLGVGQPDQVSLAATEGLAPRAMRGVHYQGKRGVAVGQGGAVLLNDGPGWSFAENAKVLPLEVRQCWDFHAVHGAAGHFWAVGRPGSVVLHSRNNGDGWEVQYTRQNLPLNGVFFLDERTGWAVGELGVILTTVDGGKNWKMQRRGGERAAVLFLHSRAAGMPLDGAALLGGQDGYLTAAVRVISPDPNTAAPARCTEANRLTVAWRQAGGASAEMLWQFPLGAHAVRSPRDELVKVWQEQELHGAHAADNLLRQMVLAIRLWRPDVIITDSPGVVAAGFGSDGLTSEAVREAFRQAGDPKAFPEHIQYLGLEVWQPKKVYARWEGLAEAEVKVDLTAIIPALQATLREFASVPAGLLTDGTVQIPAMRQYRFLGGVEGTQKHTDLMQGLNLQPGGLARRPLLASSELSAEEMKAIRQRATLQALSESRTTDVNTPERLLGAMGKLLDDMPDDMGGRAAFGIANQFAQGGNWSLAAEAFRHMTERYPAHPLTAEAYRWLIRHYSSSEARRRYELGHFTSRTLTEYGLKGAGNQPPPNPDALLKPAVKVEVPQIETREITQMGYNPKLVKEWHQYPKELEKKLASFGPLFAKDPSVQFCLQATRRQLGEFAEARKWYNHFVQTQPDGPWRAAAQAELWLLDRTQPLTKPLARIYPVETKPFLDGKLDDPCWKNVRPLMLWVASGDVQKAPPPADDPKAREKALENAPAEVRRFLHDYPTEVRLAYDKEYLYVAVRCFHPAEKHVPPVKGRTRDADLRAFDRVSILLDLDRDYSTCFHLQIDQRSCVAEDCWGDKTWNPRWYVAVNSEPTVWTAEAAIPLSALTNEEVMPGRAWAFNAVRVLPGRGVQAWSLPAEVPEESPRPEGMGLLLFEKDPPPAAILSPTAPMPRAP